MKRHFLILLTLTVALLMSLQISVFAAEEHEWIGPVVDALLDPPVRNGQRATVSYWDSSADCYGDVLTGIAKEIYDELERKFIAHEAGIEEIPLELLQFDDGQEYAWAFKGLLTYNGSSQSANKAWIDEAADAADAALRGFVYDHPEYFWIREAYNIRGSWNNYSASLNLYYIAQSGFENQAEQKEALWEIVDELVAAVEGLTEAQKVAWWDNWLAVNNRYNGGALADNYISTDATPWCVIGAMLDGYQPVCEGYAKALQLLCHEAGIPCVQISGETDGGGHMWTAVKLNHNWYFCDPTWDDPNPDENSWNYSKREHLLTTQPGTHTTLDRIGIGTPTISSTPFFEQRWVTLYSDPYMESVVPSEWLMDEQAGVCGLEIGSNTMVIALYGEGGKFLGVGTCEAMRWSASEYIYLAPAFDRNLLEQAVSAVRFNTEAWVPVSTALPIKVK